MELDLSPLRTLTVIAAVGSGLAAGVFFAFSSFVMTGLGRAPAPVGIRAMQEINRAAPTPAFMTVLFGTGALLAVLAVLAVARAAEGAWLIVAATLLYLVCLVLTITYHVPHNDRLAMLDPSAADSADAWRDYLSGWVRLNHLRTASATSACALLVLAARGR